MLNNLDKPVSSKITTQNDKMSDDLDNIERITRKQDEEIDDSPIQKRNKGRKFIINDDDFWEI